MTFMSSILTIEGLFLKNSYFLQLRKSYFLWLKNVFQIRDSFSFPFLPHLQNSNTINLKAFFKNNLGWILICDWEVITHIWSHKKKDEQTESQQLFVDPLEDWGHWTNHDPQHWEKDERYREPQLTGAEAQKQRPQLTHHQNREICNWWIARSPLESLSWKFQGHLVIKGAPTFLWVLLKGSQTGSHSEYWRKRAKIAILKYSRMFCSS